jgi:hypothetical protein
VRPLGLNFVLLVSMTLLGGCTLPRSIDRTPDTELYFCLQTRADTYLVRNWNLCPTFAPAPRYLHWGGIWQLRIITNEEYLARQFTLQDKIHSNKKTCSIPSIAAEILPVPNGTKLLIENVTREMNFSLGQTIYLSGDIFINGESYGFNFRDYGKEAENAIQYDIQQLFDVCENSKIKNR